MSVYNFADMPKVTIAMAVYKPNIDWFMEQLNSLNQQDYTGDIELLVWNDSPNDFEVESYLKHTITSMEFQIFSDGQNHGPTIAFEKLTKIATGDYIAYCDQDDIWLCEKLSKMVEFMQANLEIAGCHCNIAFIDGEGNAIKGNFIQKKDLFGWNDYDWQFKKTLVQNKSYGCAIMIKTDAAKKAIPFSRHVYHDQWLALYAIQHGGYKFMEDVLIYHREHGANTTSRLVGIRTKADYYNKKLKREYLFFREARARADNLGNFDEVLNWVKARVKYKDKVTVATFFDLLRFAKIRWDVSFFELLMPFLSEKMFEKIVSRIS